MQDRLKGVAERLFPRRQRLIHVSQVAAEILGDDPNTAAAEVRAEILNWLSQPKRAGALPKAALEQQDFEINDPGLQVVGLRLIKDDFDYWVVRFDHLDDRAVARGWSTELTVAVVDGRALFGSRVTLSSREDNPEYQSSVPSIVRRLAKRPGLAVDSERVRSDLWRIGTKDDVEQLVEAIRDPGRALPLYVVSLAPDQDDERFALIDVRALAGRCAGVATVAVITGAAGFELTKLLGKEYSVFRQAVRLYRPGFDDSSDSPYQHPLYLSHRIQDWQSVGPSAFGEHLVRLACDDSVGRQKDSERVLPRFNTVKKIAMNWRRDEAHRSGNQEGEIEALRDEVRSLAQEIETALDLADGAEKERDAIRDQLKDQQDQNRQLLWQLNEFRSRLERQTGRSLDVDIPIPDTLKDLKRWSSEHLAGRVVMTPRAIRAAKDSPFEDVPLVYKALLLLANEYRRMRVEGGPQSQEAFDAALRALRLENSRSGDPARLGEQGSEYIVEHSGQRHLLDWHIKKPGNTREPTRCLRIYYTFDDQSQQVIVGSLPGHLDTRET